MPEFWGDDTIAAYRQSWLGKEDLVEEILKILKGSGITDEHDEIIRRISRANEFLIQNGIKPIETERTIKLRIKKGSVYSSAVLPALDLRGMVIPSGTNVDGIVLCGAQAEGMSFQGASLQGSHLEYACLERANMMECNLGNAILAEADLGGAVFYETNLRNANLQGAKMEAAHFVNVHIEGSDFSYVRFGSANLILYEDPLATNPKLIKRREQTIFKNCYYLPAWPGHFIRKYFVVREIERAPFIERKVIRKIECNWKSFVNHSFHRWFYTKFIQTPIDDANTVMAPDLYRYIKDQQFIIRYKIKHRIAYWFWKILSDCGGKLSVVAFGSALIVLLFSKLYLWTSSIDPKALGNAATNLSGNWLWIFISFDIFSNLGIRNTQPLHPFGVILMIWESLLGFMMLGMLISVLQNRFARRS